MIGGHVQRFEVVVVRLHFGALSHRVAHADQDVQRPIDHAVEGVNAPLGPIAAGHGDVQGLRVELSLNGGCF